MNITDFQHVFVINLSRRPDRYEQFNATYDKSGMPWTVERYDACDYRGKSPPIWFGSRANAGAYGCWRSHRQILELALNNHWENVLIFEDDCTFVPGAKEILEAALSELPDDWGFLYLGGQYHHRTLEPSFKIRWPFLASDHLARAYNLNRTHAYAVNRRYVKTILDFLNRNNLNGRPAHIDHQYGCLQESGEVPVYCVYPFICGQRAGSSDVGGKMSITQIWNINIMGTENKNYFGVALSDFKVGYGELGLNGELGYEGKSVSVRVKDSDEWQTISVHAPSDGKIMAYEPIEIYGALNTDLNAQYTCTAVIDGEVIGTVKFAGDRTETFTIPAGEHRLTFRVGGKNGGAHTIWVFRKVKIPGAEKVVITETAPTVIEDVIASEPSEIDPGPTITETVEDDVTPTNVFDLSRLKQKETADGDAGDSDGGGEISAE